MKVLIWLSLVSFLPTTTCVSYSFPTRYQAQVQGWVNDFMLNNSPVNLLGFMFVDYSQTLMRVDEIWNKSAIYNTPLFTEWGISEDHHLQTPQGTYFFYSNDSGNYCAPQPPMMLPQEIFPDDSYIGETIFNDVLCYVFNATTATSYCEGYVSVKDEVPLAMYTWNQFGNFTIQTMQYFLSFQEVDSFPSGAKLFSVPSYCNQKK